MRNLNNFVALCWLLSMACGAATATAQLKLENASVLAGRWSIDSARTPEGDTLHGAVEMRPEGGIVELIWNTSKGTNSGIGFYIDGHLYVGRSRYRGYGIAVYRLTPKGIEGIWAFAGGRSIGTELGAGGSLEKSRSTYQVAGTNPDGTPYTGRLILTRLMSDSTLFSVVWYIGDDRFEGIALRRGGILVIGWGNGEKVDLLDYTADASVATGPTATSGVSSVGSERLIRYVPVPDRDQRIGPGVRPEGGGE